MNHASAPNLLLITSDQQHWSTLGFWNPRIQTPALDRLAAMGTHFTRGYCPNPTCTPTRGSIITGQYPSAHGAWTLGTSLPQDTPTLGTHLATAGYTSTLIGKAHFQALRATAESPSVESYPTLRDLDFWRTFNQRHTPWYGFDHVELARNHADEGHAGQHYGLWLQQQGLDDWRAYFQAPHAGAPDAPEVDTRSCKRPPRTVEDMRWALPQQYHYTTWTGQRTITALEQAKADGRPFFLWSSYHDPHPPYCLPQPWCSMYDPADMDPGELSDDELAMMPPPHRMTQDPDADFSGFDADGWGNHGYGYQKRDREHLQHAMAVYYAMVSFMDHWIGQTLDALERLGQLERTLIVFTSDHGHFLGQHGLTAKGPFHYEDVIRVPLIAAWPGRIPAGRSCDAIQSLVDLAPTFLDAAGRDIPLDMQGVSQLPTWEGGAAVRRWAMVENHHNRGAVHLRTLVTDRYKLTVYRGHRDWGELFDLESDPGETHNLFHDQDAAARRGELMEQLVQADLEREPAPTPRVWGA